MKGSFSNGKESGHRGTKIKRLTAIAENKDCAEQHEDDMDSKSMLLWISFDAAYAQDLYRSWSTAERKLLQRFLEAPLAVGAIIGSGNF